jgi:hypothetical protein
MEDIEMDNDKSRRLSLTIAGVLITVGIGAAAAAHEGDEVATAVPHAAPPAAAILQLEAARQATARYVDVDEAVADGYVDVGVFFPNMGWHYLRGELLDAKFEATAPEFLVYADDPCGGKRKLVAVEYAVPLDLSRKAPQGFEGPADAWATNTDFGLWTLHAWVFELNPDGVFAAYNSRVP